MSVMSEVSGEESSRSAKVDGERAVNTLAEAVHAIRQFFVAGKPQQLQLLYRDVRLTLVKADNSELPPPFEPQIFRWDELYSSVRFPTLIRALLEDPRVNFCCLLITQQMNSPCWIIESDPVQ